MDITRHTWYGLVSHDNVSDVAQRLFTMLNGQLYTFVAYNDGFNPESNIGLEVRVDEYLERSTYGPPIVLYTDNNHISVCDSYGTWGFGDGAYVKFEGNSMKVIHKAPAGNNLIWVVKAQDAKSDTYFNSIHVM